MTTEEYIKAYTKTCSNQLSFVDGDKRPMFAPWLTPDHARNVAQMTRKETIEEINEALLSEVLPCFMHGGEADEVVAKLEEVLSEKAKNSE